MTADSNVRTSAGRTDANQQDQARNQQANQAQQENERRERERAQQEEMNRAQGSARDAASDMRESLQSGAEAARRGMENVASDMAEQTRRTTGSIKEALDVHRDTVHSAAEDFKAAATAASISADAVVKIDSALVDWMGQSVQAMTRVSQRLLGSRTPREAADAQREFSETIMKSWMQNNAQILRVTQDCAGRALEPLTERVEQHEHA
jgi:enamine deaminase RidA (YjgF/YER057c/UK114 family)